MANRTDTQADTVHGGNPQYLVDRIVRVKIYNDAYWKEHCFALTTETLIDRAAELDYVSGTYGGRRRPAKFLCLILKMLQIQPDEDVIMEYIKQPDLKYLRALGVVYLRLTGRAKTVYETLEPMYADYRKLRYRNIMGKLSIIHMDELIDWCFHEETIVDITMPQLPKRDVLEYSDMLGPRLSILDDDLEDLEELEEAMNPKKVETQTDAPAADAAAPTEVSVAAAADGSPERRSVTGERSPSHGKRSPSRGEKEVQRKRSESQKRRRSRGRSKSHRRQRSRSERRQTTRHRSRSRQASEESRDKDRRKEKAKKEREREREKEKDKEKAKKEKEKDKERERPTEEERHDKKEKKEKKEKKALEEKEPKVGKEKKEKEEKKKERNRSMEKCRSQLERNEKLEEAKRQLMEPEKKKKKGLFKAEREGGVLKPEKEKSGKSSKDKDGLSVDEWNAVRKELGLKPLG